MMDLQAVGKKEDLRVETPGVHILIEIGQIWIFSDRLVKGIPAKLLAEQFNQGRLSDANIPGDDNVFFHYATFARSGNFASELHIDHALKDLKWLRTYQRQAVYEEGRGRLYA
jgi:hypothetical protein